jgi:hypothetical protein
MIKKSILSVVLAAGLATPPKGLAASHREAPITALDHKADITHFFAFVSYRISGRSPAARVSQ